MKYLLGIDFGGGSSKATLLSEKGEIVAESSVEYPTYYTEDGGCEQEPSDWIEALCENTSIILKKSDINCTDIAGIAIDSATHTSILCDEDFLPLRRAIHWTDSRSKCESDFLREKFGDLIFKKSFHKPDTIWTLPQLLWVKNNEGELLGKTRHIFFEKDYIRYFLTGVYCTDYIEAEGSMLFDLESLSWDRELCELVGIRENILPEVKNPKDIVGAVTDVAAKKTGLCVGTPVICGTTDTVMEIFASGAVKRGDITVKLATAGRICVITDKPYPDRHIINYSHIVDGLWYPGTATKAAAAAYRWYRDTFGGEYIELDEGAKNVNVGSDGLMFHPYINGELTPYADPNLCGSFIGVRAIHSKAHFTRAVLEGVAFSLLDSKLYLDGMKISYNTTATLIGGGAKGMLWAQIVSDVLGISLKLTESSDSSLGSAMLAGVALGIFADEKEAVRLCVKEKGRVHPRAEFTEKYRNLFKKYKAVQSVLSKIYHEF